MWQPSGEIITTIRHCRGKCNPSLITYRTFCPHRTIWSFDVRTVGIWPVLPGSFVRCPGSKRLPRPLPTIPCRRRSRPRPSWGCCPRSRPLRCAFRCLRRPARPGYPRPCPRRASKATTLYCSSTPPQNLYKHNNRTHLISAVILVHIK